MRTQRIRMAAWGLIGLMVLVFIGLAGAAGDVPSPAFIAAALRDQASVNLEVRYQTIAGYPGKESAFKTRYIRSQDVVYTEETEADESLTKTSYDRAKEEQRKLSTRVGELRSYGEIQGFLGIPFDTQSFVETALYRIHEGALCDVIANGSVAADKEMVDGHECWRIDVPSTRDVISEYVVWVDPEIAFCPRRVHIVWKDAPVQAIDFKEYVQVGTKAWFPRLHTVELVTEKGTLRVVSRVSSIDADKHYSRDALVVQFPSGTRVHTGDTEFTVP